MQKESYEKELAALKSVVKCLENHKLDASKLASLEVEQKIAECEQKIAECEKEISKAEQGLQDKSLKRKYAEPLKYHYDEAKQICSSSLIASDGQLLQSTRQTQGQGTTAIFDSRHAYSGYVANNIPLSSEISQGTSWTNFLKWEVEFFANGLM